ncbi:MAG: hypothetical protein V3G42_03580 [Oscillospiraceae bacterium]
MALSHEQRVNDVIRNLTKHGAIIVSSTHTPFGISPMYLVCNIVYESEDVIADTNMEGENHERR